MEVILSDSVPIKVRMQDSVNTLDLHLNNGEDIYGNQMIPIAPIRTN